MCVWERERATERIKEGKFQSNNLTTDTKLHLRGSQGICCRLNQKNKDFDWNSFLESNELLWKLRKTKMLFLEYIYILKNRTKIYISIYYTYIDILYIYLDIYIIRIYIYIIELKFRKNKLKRKQWRKLATL